MGVFTNAPDQHQALEKRKVVFFTGSTALVKGQGLCYDQDYTDADATLPPQTAEDAYGGRRVKVELPSTSNNYAFAGTTVKSYSAKTGGQWVEITEPGGCGWIAVAEDTTYNSTYMTVTCGTGVGGYFSHQGFMGRGTALALQSTETASSSIASGPIVQEWTGGGSCTSAGVITDSGAFSNVVAGDKVLIYGGSAESADSLGGLATPGIYTVSSRTDNTVTLSTSPCDVTCSVTYSVIRGESCVYARLFDGEESGGVQFVNTVSDTIGDDPMAGGWSFFLGGFELNSGTAYIAEVAEGTFYGQKKAFEVLGDLGTESDIDIDFATHGIQRNVVDYEVSTTETGGTPKELGAFTMDEDGDTLIVEWMGQWRVLYVSSGVTVSES